MAIKKKVVKTPAVRVETRKVWKQDACTTHSCYKITALVILILLLLNTVLVSLVLVRQEKLEADRVGGRQNYQMIKKIYKTDMFKSQQSQQILEALNMYEGGVQPQIDPVMMSEESLVE